MTATRLPYPFHQLDHPFACMPSLPNPPEPEAARAAIARLSALELLDMRPGPLFVPEASRAETPHDLLVRAGPPIVAAIEAAIDGATGTGRVALTSVLLDLAPERADRVLRKLVHDRTPAVVNTCLVGYRTVQDWAESIAGRLEQDGAPSFGLAQRKAPQRLAPWLIKLIVAAVIVGGWAYLKWSFR